MNANTYSRKRPQSERYVNYKCFYLEYAYRIGTPLTVLKMLVKTVVNFFIIHLFKLKLT